MYRQQFITKNLHIVQKVDIFRFLERKKYVFGHLFKNKCISLQHKEEYKGKNIIKIGLQM